MRPAISSVYNSLGMCEAFPEGIHKQKQWNSHRILCTFLSLVSLLGIIRPVPISCPIVKSLGDREAVFLCYFNRRNPVVFVTSKIKWVYYSFETQRQHTIISTIIQLHVSVSSRPSSGQYSDSNYVYVHIEYDINLNLNVHMTTSFRSTRQLYTNIPYEMTQFYNESTFITDTKHLHSVFTNFNVSPCIFQFNN